MDCLVSEDPRTQFTVGFLFSQSGRKVALVHKKRPAWQAGKLNGIGGGREEGETFLDTQRREFREETSFDFDDWERIGVMRCATCTVIIYRGFLPSDKLPELVPEKREDDAEPEDPEWINIEDVRDHFHFGRFLHNIPWLVNFCLDTRGLKQDICINYRPEK